MIISAKKFFDKLKLAEDFIQFISNKNSNVERKYLKLISNS